MTKKILTRELVEANICSGNQPNRFMNEHERISLRNVAAGEKRRVAQVKGQGALRQRILDMGLTKGTEVTVRKVAPLGDPIEVTVRGYELSLRKAEASCIIMA